MVNPDPPRRTRDQGRKNQPRMNTDGRGWGIGCTAGTAFSTTNDANGANGDGRTKATTDLTDFGSVVARGVDPGGNILTGTRSCRLHSDRFWSPRRPRRGGNGPRLTAPGYSEKKPPFVSIRVHLRLKMPVFRPEIAIFHRKTAPNGPKTAFSNHFSPARPVADRFR